MRLVSAIYGDAYPFDEVGIFTDFYDTRDPDDLKEGDSLVVWGGEDISPHLYGRERGKYMFADRISKRDAIEWALMTRAVALGVPIIGICRGAQMLCAKSGGALFQHVNGHAGPHHRVETDDGEVFYVNSLHHQMMNPEGTEHTLVAWSQDVLSDVHYDINNDVKVEVEPEFVYFPKTKGIAVQWHPEMISPEERCNKYLFDWLRKYYGID
jgi:putative glutamine amidotransferase